MIRDLFNRIKVVDRTEEPQVQTNSDTDIVSQIVDTLGYESCCFLIINGDLSDAGVVVSVKLEEGDNSGLSDAAAVATKDIQLDTRMDAVPEATFQAAYDETDDFKTFKVGYKGGKRYLRLTLSPVGNAAGSIPIAVATVLSNARHGDNVNNATQTP